MMALQGGSVPFKDTLKSLDQELNHQPLALETKLLLPIETYYKNLKSKIVRNLYFPEIPFILLKATEVIYFAYLECKTDE